MIAELIIVALLVLSTASFCFWFCVYEKWHQEQMWIVRLQERQRIAEWILSDCYRKLDQSDDWIRKQNVQLRVLDALNVIDPWNRFSLDPDLIDDSQPSIS